MRLTIYLYVIRKNYGQNEIMEVIWIQTDQNRNDDFTNQKLIRCLLI